MKKLGIPQGKWEALEYSLVGIKRDPIDHKTVAHTFSHKNRDECKAISVLIADAGNTAQKCGLYPSELLKQRDELLECVDLVLGSFSLERTESYSLMDKCREAIEKATE